MKKKNVQAKKVYYRKLLQKGLEIRFRNPSFENLPREHALDPARTNRASIVLLRSLGPIISLLLTCFKKWRSESRSSGYVNELS